MKPFELLARDRFAARLGARITFQRPDRLGLAMEVGPQHLDRQDNIAGGVLFSLADCAMSLISNSEARAVAVSAHLVAASGHRGAGLTAEVVAITPIDDDAVTWQAQVAADGRVVAIFTATTLRLQR